MAACKKMSYTYISVFGQLRSQTAPSRRQQRGHRVPTARVNIWGDRTAPIIHRRTFRPARVGALALHCSNHVPHNHGQNKRSTRCATIVTPRTHPSRYYTPRTEHDDVLRLQVMLSKSQPGLLSPPRSELRVLVRDLIVWYSGTSFSILVKPNVLTDAPSVEHLPHSLASCNMSSEALILPGISVARH